ncbi:CbtA family protein [Alkalimarinus coralli]|uniref:CbtA family protein n=1 Tax=Alkalimarinus coralli TaxID=2935863 RepID=UPI00202AD810|nr:CbtA family protein [Alkalimarinus coralli]
MFFRNIVFAAVAAGLLAGIILGTLQHFQVTPIILGAEVYEIADELPSSTDMAAGEATAHDHSNPAHHTSENISGHFEALENNSDTASKQHIQEHSHDPEAWGPEDGAERTFFTFLSSTLMAIGFSLVVISGMALSGKTSPVAGLLWGLAGYLSFFVSPSLGLPPEIPGMEAAALEGRQSWWLLAVTFTSLGLGLLAFGKGALRWGGLLVIAIPHILGAPQPAMHGFAHPDANAVAALEALVGQFVMATTVVNGVFWVCLGLLSAIAINTLFKLPDEESTGAA